MFDADRNHQMLSRTAEGTPVRSLLLETLERRLLLSGDTMLGGADPNLNLVLESAPEIIVAGVNMPAVGAGIQGPSDVLAAPGPTQRIVPDPVTQPVLPGSAFSITVTYSTDPVDETLTGLGLLLHYNSSLLRWDSFRSVYAGGKVAQDSSPQNDTANADGDLSTDKYVMIAWADLSSNWPGVGLPLDLYVANFTALPAFVSDSTTINFSASSTTAGWTLGATSATITLENQTPTDITLSGASVAENQPVNTLVGSLSTTDPDTGNTFTYSLIDGTGGTDNGLFTIVGAQLQTAAVFNYEVQDSYSIRVRSTDQGGMSTEKVFTIAVMDVNENPTDITLAGASVAENASVNTVVGSFGTTDPDTGSTFSYSLVSGTGSTDNGAFAIVGNQLQTAAMFNYEVKNSYSIRVRSTDQGGLYTEKPFTIAVTNVNENPTDITLSATSVAENAPVNTVVGSFGTTDQDTGNTFTYSLVSGTGAADNGAFAIIGSQLQTAAVFNYEVKNSYSIRVHSTDQGGLSTEKVFTIAVTDVNEAPTVALANTTTSLPENTSIASRLKVADIVVTDDALGTNVLSLSGTDAALFEIVGTGLYLRAGTVLDYETNPVLDVTVAVDDATVGGAPDSTAALAIAVTAVNGNPTDIALSGGSVAENQPAGALIGALSTADPDPGNTFTYSLVSGEGATDNSLFTIGGSELRTAAVFNYEVKNSYSIRVRSTDQGGLSTEKVFSISIIDMNENPTDISVSGVSVAENQPASTVVGSFTTTDPDTGNTFTYSLIDGTGATDNGRFTIVGTQLMTVAVFNYEVQSSYSIRLRSTDQGGLSTEKVFNIVVTNVNENPTDINVSGVSAAENQPVGTVVGSLNTMDPDTGNTFTYSLVSGTGAADNGLFTIVGAQLQTAAVFNYEVQNSYSIRVRSTDQGGLSTEKVFSLAVTDLNEAPTVALANTTTSLPENMDTSSPIKVADIVVTDDALGTNVVSLEGAEAALFEIVGEELYLKAGTVLNYETKPALEVVVAVDDADVGATPDSVAALSIDITDVNQPPTVALTNTIASLAEDADTTDPVKVADIVVTDDALGTNVLSLEGPDVSLFEIVGEGLYLKAGAVLDHETKPVLEVTVAVDDATLGAGVDDMAALAIAVTDVNEAPAVELTNTITSLAENTDTSSPIKVADIVVTDDASGTNVLSLEGANAALFEIVDTGLYLKAGTVLDYETNPVLDVAVAVTDATLVPPAEDTATLAIDIMDVNEPPTVALTNMVTSLPENADTSSAIRVADIAVTDDALGMNVLSLDGADAALFEIVGTELYLKAGTVLNHEAQPFLNVLMAVDDTTLGSTVEDTAALSIGVTDVNEAPTVALTNTVTSLAENTDTTSPIQVADIVVTDDTLGTNILSLEGTDEALFEIVGMGLYLKAGTVLDYETNPLLEVTVAVDDVTLGSTVEDIALLSIDITDVNESPTVALRNTVTSLAENTDTTSRVKVADIMVTDDALGTNDLSLSGPDAALFEIDGLVLYLKAGTVLDYETKPALNVTAAVNDPELGDTPDAMATLSIDITDVNQPPTVELANTVTSLAENANTSSPIKVADIVVTDDALGMNVLSLDGADAALFEIVGTGLYLKAGTVLDYETKAALNVAVAVDDPAVGGTPDDTASLLINIIDVNEAPAVALANTVTSLAENADTSGGIKVADIGVTDDALGTNVLSLEGADAALFEIVGTGLYLQAGTVLDYETKALLSVAVAVDDATLGAGADDMAALAIAVTDVNEAPAVALTNMVTSLAEDTDTTSAIKVADIVVTDDALGTNVLGLVGPDAALFEIVGTGLYLKAGTILDYETNPLWDVTVVVDDTTLGSGVDDTAGLSISMTDVNEAPTVDLTSLVASLPEDTNTSGPIRVADIGVTDDALGTNVLSLEGADAALFEIVDTGLYLKARTALDYETKAALNVGVAVDDPTVGGTPDDTASLLINIVDVNEAPKVALANTVTSLAENTDTNSPIKVADIVVTDDALGTNVLSLEGADDALFEIIDTGLYLKAGAVLDYETQAVLNVAVAVDDLAVGDTPDAVATLSINVTDVNQPPTVALANTVTTLPEDTNTGSSVKVADIVVTDDALGTDVLSLGGADAALFEIIGTGLYLKAGTTLDYETHSLLEATVAVDDATIGSTAEDTAALSITVTDVNEAPTVTLENMVTSLGENADTSSSIKVADVVVTDDALGTNELSLGGTDAALFEIVGTGLYLKAGTVLNYATKPVLEVVVQVDDPDVGTTPDATAALSIDITDVNQPPTVELTNTVTTLAEDTDTSSPIKVADIVVTDDALGTNTLSLEGMDAALFEIVGTGLYLKAGTPLDYETQAALNVGVVVDDPAVGSTPDGAAALSITVTDVNEAPTIALANTVTTLAENADTSSAIKVADIVVTDDALGTNVLNLEGTDAALFEIVGTGLYLKAGTVLNYETKPALEVVVAVDDADVGATPDSVAALSIDITDVNQPPTVALTNTITSLAENADTSSAIKVADIVVSDDALGTNVLSLEGADAALFEIVGEGLYLKAGTVLDYETKAALNVAVAVDDPAVGSTPDDTASLLISIIDVNEAPAVALANTVTSLAENADTSGGIKVADIVVTDDALGMNELSLSGADASLFEIVGTGLYLKAGTALDYEAKAALNVTVAVDDPTVGGTPDAAAVLSIAVMDVNEAPTVALANMLTDLAENADTSSAIKVADIVVTDDALGTNVLSLEGTDASLFEIVGEGLYLKAGTVLDYEAKAALNVTVAVDDPTVGGTPDAAAVLSIAVTDVNEAPTVALANTITSLAEDTDTTTRIKVADVVVTDDALGTNVLSLEGADAALFEIVDTELYLKAGTVLDYTTNPVLDVTVAADDAGVGATPDAAATLSISITDVNQPPTVTLTNTVTSLTDSTHISRRMKVADIVVTDDGLGTNELSLSGAQAAMFEIRGLVLYLKGGTTLNYETTPVLEVVVAVNDASVGNTPDDTATLLISITDVNEAPSVALANTVTSLPEDTDTTSRVKVADIVVTDDALGTNALSLSGVNAAWFEIDPTAVAGAGSAALYLKAGTTLDYETTPVLAVVVAVNDASVGATPDGMAALSITVTDVNEAPTVALANTVTSLAEDTDTTSRIKVADIVVTDDALGVNDLSLSGTNAALFEIAGLTLYLKAGTTLDYETTPVLDVVVAVDDTDVGDTPDSTATLSINIIQVNQPPTVALTNTTTSLAENTDTTSRIKVADIVVTDDTPGMDVLSLEGADAALFEIVGTGLYLQAGTVLDYETNSLLEVTVAVDDASVGATPDSTATLSITVTDVNEAPTVALANTVTSLAENTDTSSRIKVADIAVTDDALGINELSLSGAQADLFEMDGPALYLKVGTTLDYETASVLEVVVAVNDTSVGDTPDATAALAISITDVNEPPVVVNDTVTTDEDTPVIISAAILLSNDSDPDGDTLSITGIDTTGTHGLVTDNGDGTYTYNPNGQFDYLSVGASATDSFLVTVADEHGLTTTGTVTITVTGASDLRIDRYTVRSSRVVANNYIKMSGYFDVPEAKLVAGAQIQVVILASGGTSLFSQVITINAADLRQGVYTYRTSLQPKSSSAGITLLKLDTRQHTFDLCVEGLDLSRLSYPLTLKLTVGDYFGSGETH